MKIKNLSLIFFLINQVIFSQNNKEQTAQNWLNQHKKELKIQDNHELKMLFNREGPSGENFRYYQFVNNVQVFDASIVVHVSNNNKVTYYASTYDNEINAINTTPLISKEQALNIAKQALNINSTNFLENKLFIYHKNKNTNLVYRVVTHSYNRVGHWESLINAHTGNVISIKDISFYYKKEKDGDKKKKKSPNKILSVNVNGTGMVYNTDPLTATLNTYGGNYSDNNDATNAALNDARTSVTLIGIEQNGLNYKLKGQYVEIADLEVPSTGLFIQNSPDFNFTRDQQGFEAVNIYYHTDKSIRYINQTLGITLVSLYNGGVLKYDPHAWDGADQSSYGGGMLTMGEGGVDDGEDADVILHELGHGLHDWITNGSLSQTEGLSEGCGDYWANSYKRSLGQWTSSDPSYYYVFGWDGHNPFFDGRVTNNNAHYPEGLGGTIHAKGTIWASCLMEIWELVGKENTDKAFLEGLAMTNSNTNQQNAAIAVRQAAIDMGLSCTDIQHFTDRFEARGYVLPEYNCSEFALDAIVSITIPEISCGSNDVNPIIKLKNIGSTTITSATINWNFDNGSNTIINWTGSLDQFEEENISIGITSLSSGSHTFNATVSNPNGETDQGTDNNSKTKTFDIANSYNTTQIHLDLLTDTYCEETSWTFKDTNGTILYSGGPYTQNTQDSTHFYEDFNVSANQCYTFEILDSANDGIYSNSFGYGSYTLKTNDDIVIFSGGNFTSNEITEISIGSTASTNDILSKNITIYPNPTNINLNVNLNSISGEFKYTLVNTLGQLVLQGNLLNTNNLLNVSSIDKGIYFLKIEDNLSDNSMVEKIIIK